MRILDCVLLTLALIGAAGPALADPATLVIAALGVPSAGVAAFAIRIGVGLAFTALSSALTSGAANANSAPRGIQIRSTTAGEQTPQSFILGTYVTAGNLVAPEMSHGVDGDTRYLTRVLDVSDIRVEGLLYAIIDGRKIEFDGATDPDYGTTTTEADFEDFVWCRFKTGSQTTADADLLSIYGSYPERPWESEMVGVGVAHAILTFLWRDEPQIWQGRPDVRLVVQGIRLYDPRKDTTAGGSGSHRYGDTSTHEWSDNPVVMIYNLFRGIQIRGDKIFGGGFAAADLPYAVWAAAMNSCDVLVGSRKTYVAGLEVFMGGSDAGGQSPADVVEDLLKACSGQIADVGGTIYIRVGAPGLPVKFITDDDVLVSQPQDLDPFPGAEDSYNVVHATWVNPFGLWTVREIKPVRDEDAIAADGQELVADVPLPAVTNGAQVQQLTNAWLRDAQRHRRHNIGLPPEGILLRPLDVIDWTSTRNGYSGKAFEIGQVGIDPQTLCTTLALREVNPDDYDWEVGDEIAVDAPSVETVTPSAQTVPGWAASATTIQDAAGTGRRPAILMQWNAPLPGVSGLQIQVRVKATGNLVFTGSTENVSQGSFRLAAGVLPETTYQTRARLKTGKKTAWTDWTAAEVTTGAQYTNTVDLAGRSVTIPARISRPAKRALTSTSTWVRLASVTIDRAAGYITEFDVAFALDGLGTGVAVTRILRGSTIVGSAAAFTTGERGSQDQKAWTHKDDQTNGGKVTYHLEARKGTLGSTSPTVNVWNVFFKAMQVKR